MLRLKYVTHKILSPTKPKRPTWNKVDGEMIFVVLLYN